MYKIKHLGNQIASTNICERVYRSHKLTGCHQFNKSIHEISSIINVPDSAVSGIITKWKQLITTAPQLILRRIVLRHTVRKSNQHFVIATYLSAQTICGLQIISRTMCRELHRMGLWPTQSPDLNPTKHLWDEWEQTLRPRPSHATSVPRKCVSSINIKN